MWLNNYFEMDISIHWKYGYLICTVWKLSFAKKKKTSKLKVNFKCRRLAIISFSNDDSPSRLRSFKTLLTPTWRIYHEIVSILFASMVDLYPDDGIACTYIFLSSDNLDSSTLRGWVTTSEIFSKEISRWHVVLFFIVIVKCETGFNHE